MASKVLYHDKCFDGFTAAWAAWKRFGDTAEYIPVSYGAPLPVPDPLDELYFLDFCPPIEYLRTLGHSVRLTILDHHKTAEDSLRLFKPQPEDVIVFDMERSGAGIAWDYFFMKPRPKLVNYAEDHDLWRYRLPDSRSIRAYMHSSPYTFAAWDSMCRYLDYDYPEAVMMGRAIQGFMKQQVKMICDQAELQLVGGIMVPVVNATSLWSEVGEELNLRYPEARFSAYWHILADGRKKWGLRTKHQNFDVSEVAQAFGGGGHKGAAGWVAPRQGD